MKKIKILNEELGITEEIDKAICVYETSGHNVDDHRTETIEFGQPIYNIKLLETGSMVYTTSPESESYFVTPFRQMFGYAQQKQINEIKNLEAQVEELEAKIKRVFENIERIGHTKFPL